MIYRKSELEDCENVYQLICELENESLDFEMFSKIYKEQQNSFNYYCLLCELNDQVIGLLNMRFEGQLHHAEYIAEIMEFVILPDYRGEGIGKEMFAKACEIAKINGCTRLELSSNQRRKNAHRFYLRKGLENTSYKFSQSLEYIDLTK